MLKMKSKLLFRLTYQINIKTLTNIYLDTICKKKYSFIINILIVSLKCFLKQILIVLFIIRSMK